MNSKNSLEIRHGFCAEGARVDLQGFKHLAVVVLAAVVARGVQVSIRNLPAILDVAILSEVLQMLGGRIATKDGECFIDSTELSSMYISDRITEQIHGSIYLVPALLGRFKEVDLGQFGGCQIGDDSAQNQRPIKHVCDVLSRFGAAVEENCGRVVGRASGFHACEIDIMDFSDYDYILSGPCVSGATKTAIIAALNVSEGTTIIRNYYFKPDVLELLSFIKHIGYSVQRDDEKITIESPKGKAVYRDGFFRLLPDINEMMTYITYALFNDISISFTDPMLECALDGLKHEIECLEKMGISLIHKKNTQTLIVPKIQKISGIDLPVTSDGIYSDHQPFFCLIALRATGITRIIEHVWKDRFSYAEELVKLGLKLCRQGNVLTVEPGLPDRGGFELIGKDLRSVVTLIIVSSMLDESNIVYGTSHLERGYERFVERMSELGCFISIREDHERDGIAECGDAVFV